MLTSFRARGVELHDVLAITSYDSILHEPYSHEPYRTSRQSLGLELVQGSILDVVHSPHFNVDMARFHKGRRSKSESCTKSWATTLKDS